MDPYLVVITKLPGMLFTDFVDKMRRKFDTFYFIDEGTCYLRCWRLLENQQVGSYVFCSYGLKKRDMHPVTLVINAGLAYLSQLIEKSQHIVIV